MKRLAINGFGRVGRAAFKIALNSKNLQVVAINDLTDTKTLAHLLKYDTVYGIYDKKVVYDAHHLIVNGKNYPVYAIPEPKKLPWKKLGIDVVLECTGRFVKDNDAYAHIKAGAKRVILSAPAKGEGEVETCLLGVNDKNITKQKVISNASCTTNSIGPITALIDKKFKIQKAFLTTVHSYTADQNIVDGPHKDLRRARAAAQNIVPTSTGATIAITKIMPHLAGKFDGIALRVPTICGSLSDLTYIVEKNTDAQTVNQLLKSASQKSLKGIISYSEEPLVSSDILKTSYSAIVDGLLTKVIDGNLIKIFAWYDNEWGYGSRLVEMAEKII
ncbi:type I glyceraldehyde-3-phosphate dehydrogenase [Candidatus Kuenenbacteria bacterium CG_4_9_14_3_um_filter_39_14]|uniref:Glyceraldehyde-3-phosphate dehydrogenase n=7 Tax=Candidatus Kueneniibacteriota TaxID=1752740 RepID=A0A2M7ILY0_9BACT|nr:type I glyceraldehyde-3-phosphate dehydrogenase [Candidatus Kuenenbacteria bacterium]OIP56255.1 MAG: type I glyceraldehyde-3-phosphate dehydrogenase [Candidatus Kuenenbacteria bacterium CG2_30_39_24]PIP29014.1 MAG: type I glyceraldehyde-3-phosphate dehydrogenase [Candidatus Kuenenbacteria bacterium CG23_combo_of_CG06-09_8_20_14_all_39_39]PIP75881.1 MAG: type I glyceraldehyde-3-phosphate dehydrogenase [Candidatus Kuenenbacteria bacterium CG22_combo_CG10-13_8_21_14_all_39_9]PIR80836.1 MAG: typ